MLTTLAARFVCSRQEPIFRRFGRWGALLLLGSVLGCEGDDGQLATVRPILELSPAEGTALPFEQVVLQTRPVGPYFIVAKNAGDAVLVFASVRIEGADASLFRISSAPEYLGPSQKGEIFVRFEPTRPGSAEATLIVETNDPNKNRVSYPLSGSARERCVLTMSPPHQRFLVGEVHDFTVTAASTYHCEITDVSTDTVLFELVDLPALPYHIEGGGTWTLKVKNTRVADQPGVTIRDLWIKESEGTMASVSLEGEPPLGGCLSSSPSRRVMFPTTPVGTIARETVVISNGCSREAIVRSAVIGTGYYFYDVEASTFPMVVPPLGSVAIGVEYQPFSEFGDMGTLNISTNDVLSPRMALELFGQASKPRVQVFPEGVDFGTVTFRNPQGAHARSECGSRSQMVQLYSVGDAEVVISGLEIDQADYLFQISGVLVDGVPVSNVNDPIIIPPNKEGRINLQFFPTRDVPALHESTLLVHHNAEGSPSRIVLHGLGKDDVVTTDQFTQPEGPKLDILFVVANTPLNAGEQMRLQDQMAFFIQTAEAANADYQIAVTVPDSRSSNAGKFERCQPHPAIITSAYEDQATRIEALECTVDVGITGSWFYVSGLGAALRAIERAIDFTNQDPTRNPNAGFIRPDANLAVVVVTTRDDDSVESNALLRDYFFSVKGAHRPDRVAIHSLAGPVLGPCETQPRWFVSPGYRYYWMSQQTGGIYYNVCEENWQPFFAGLGVDVFNLIDEWDLTEAADPRTLTVMVRGSTVARDATNGYTYNGSSNSVQFHGGAVPLRGSEVLFKYSGMCRP